MNPLSENPQNNAPPPLRIYQGPSTGVSLPTHHQGMHPYYDNFSPRAPPSSAGYNFSSQPYYARQSQTPSGALSPYSDLPQHNAYSSYHNNVALSPRFPGGKAALNFPGDLMNGPRSAPPLAMAPATSHDAFRTPSPTPESTEIAAMPSPARSFVAQHRNMQRSMHPPTRTPSPPPTSVTPAALSNYADQVQSTSQVTNVQDGINLRCTDFVAKLWFLLDRSEYSQYIRWHTSGESFLFYPTAEFATEVLARLFKHSNVASFIRQLNLYGFQRISHLELLENGPISPSISSAPANLQDFNVPSAPASGFTHPKFMRGRPEELGSIRPKPTKRVKKPSGKQRRKQVDSDDEDDDDEDYTASQPKRRRRTAN